jgi:hypothetical protein
MVLFYYPRGYRRENGREEWLIYMGKDKYENEDLIKYGLPTDIWFHVDDMSSAHVYLRLPEGVGMDSIPEESLEDCCQLVKANSIAGSKLNNVTIVYTPWSNLRKAASMDVGQVGFVSEKLVKKYKIEKKNNDIVNRLNKTEQVLSPDLQGERAAHDAYIRQNKRAVEKQQRQNEKAAKEQQRREEDLKSYKGVMGEENMVSNKDLKAAYKDFNDYEEDFM